MNKEKQLKTIVHNQHCVLHAAEKGCVRQVSQLGN